MLAGLLLLLLKSHSSSYCPCNTQAYTPYNFENTLRGNLGCLKHSNSSHTAPEQKCSNWLPSIFSQYCAVGATFLLGAALFVPVKKKKPASGFRSFTPSQGHRLGRTLPAAPCHSAPTVLPPRHHHLFPGTDPCPPHAEQTQSADTLTRNTQEGKNVFLWWCGDSYVWHHKQIAVVKVEKSILMSVFNRSRC